MRPRFTRVVVLLTALVSVSWRSHPAVAGGSPSLEQIGSEDLAIIVNQANPVEDLSRQELRTIMLGERSHWPNGRRITLVMMDAGQPERKLVLREIYHMSEQDFITEKLSVRGGFAWQGYSEQDFARHFLRGVFTGEVFVSPKTLATPVGVRKFVFNVPGAIGYVRASDVDSSVKVIRIEGHLPGEKEYFLHVPGGK
jgi:phosphate transport system substrate-binding protein